MLLPTRVYMLLLKGSAHRIEIIYRRIGVLVPVSEARDRDDIEGEGCED